MRRSDREIPIGEAMTLLAEAKHGVLSMIDADGGPYAVPVNHAVVDGCIVIHCAVRDRKLDNLRKDARVCYTVYNVIEIDAEELTTRYSSATAFGQAELVEGASTKRQLLAGMAERLAPGATFACSDETVANIGVIRIKVDSVAGKANH